MARYVAFLRGINVGGHIVKMDVLRKVFEDLGYNNVKTFIASGNVLFDSTSKTPAALEKTIAATLKKTLGYEVATFVRTPAEVAAIAEHNAFAANDLEQGSLFVGLFPEVVDARDKRVIASLETPVDGLRVHKREVYWHARQNFRDAKFSPAKMEKLLAKPATFRNINTFRRIVALLAKMSVLIALSVTLGARAAPQEQRRVIPLKPGELISYRVALVNNWMSAVLTHSFGENDGAVATIREWSAEDLRDAWVAVHALMALFENPRLKIFQVPQHGRQVPIFLNENDRVQLVSRVTSLSQRPGRAQFLKRAALLHTDTALLAPPDRRTPVNTSFLLPERVFVETDDGTQSGTFGGDVNWEFARELLASVPEFTKDTDVRDWYRATTARFLHDEHLDSAQFVEAVMLFPNDPEIQFLAGGLHEAYADPRTQEVMSAVKITERSKFDIRSEKAELELAERAFRKAFELDPSHAEAQLRRGRTLSRLGRHQDAAVEIRAARARLDEPMLKYFAALFMAVEEEVAGRLDEATQAYQEASALYSRAQAPWVGLSQLAHRRGDRVAARELLTKTLAERDHELEDDPWWTYPRTAGRNADKLLNDLYQAIRAGEPK